MTQQENDAKMRLLQIRNKLIGFLSLPLIKSIVIIFFVLITIIFWSAVSQLFTQVTGIKSEWKDFVIYGLLANSIRDFWWNPVDRLRADITKVGTDVYNALKGERGPAGRDYISNDT